MHVLMDPLKATPYIHASHDNPDRFQAATALRADDLSEPDTVRRKRIFIDANGLIDGVIGGFVIPCCFERAIQPSCKITHDIREYLRGVFGHFAAGLTFTYHSDGHCKFVIIGPGLANPGD